MSPEAMEVSIARCRQHKATGRDLLSNEVMRAGGRPMAELVSELAIKIADTVAEGVPRRPSDRALQER